MIGTTRLYVFVLMPFDKDFDDVYKYGIKSACEKLGVYCERVDETHFLGPIYDKIINAISKADIIISDLTGRNPNVYYETGYAHALNKVMIHLCREIKDIPFDLRGFQHIEYSGRIGELEPKLIEKLKWAISYIQNKGVEIGSLSFEFYHIGKKIEQELVAGIEITYRGDGSVGQMRSSFNIDILNSGANESQYLGPVYIYTGQEIVCASSQIDFRYSSMPEPSPSEDTEYKYRHKIDFRNKFSAGEWISFPLTVFFREGLEPIKNRSLIFPIKLRFLTESSPLDFILKLNISQQNAAPPIEFLINGEYLPTNIQIKFLKQFSRDGAIEEAGCKLPIGVRNMSSRKQKIGPIHIHTTDVVRNIDTSSYRISTGTDGTFETSAEQGYTRKFILTNIDELEALAYINSEISFEINPRELPRKMKYIKIPIMIKIFTETGPILHNISIIEKT